jgi:hypothetical protein
MNNKNSKSYSYQLEKTPLALTIFFVALASVLATIISINLLENFAVNSYIAIAITAVLVILVPVVLLKNRFLLWTAIAAGTINCFYEFSLRIGISTIIALMMYVITLIAIFYFESRHNQKDNSNGI